MFEALITDFHIFPRFKEFILVFGSKSDDNEIGLPQLRYRRLPAGISMPQEPNYTGFGMNALKVEKMLTSLTAIECAYAFKYVELNHRDPVNPWSIRQTAVYHQYCRAQDMNTSTWLFVAPSERARQSVEEYTIGLSDLTTLNPFEIHLVILESSLANWRSYIIYLTEHIAAQVGIFPIICLGH